MARKRAKGTYIPCMDQDLYQGLAIDGSKAYSQIIAQTAQFTSLVLQVVDELAVLAVLAGQDLLQFENGCVNSDTAVKLENIGDGLED